jgi:hypothetical protein
LTGSISGQTGGVTNPELPTPGEMVETFVHPPRIVVVGARHDLGDDRLLIVSHVELWPWRVVVRGTMANRRPATIDPMDDQAMRAGFRSPSPCRRTREVVAHNGRKKFTRWLTGSLARPLRGCRAWSCASRRGGSPRR